MRRVIGVLLLLASAAISACSKAQAKTPAPPAPLLTPAPPDRMIVPAAIPVAIEAPVAQAPAPAAPPRPTPPPTRPAATPAPATPAAPPPPATVEPAPPPVLQTTSNPGEVEQQARTLLSAAQRDLDLINRSQLSANARAQYDTARAFVKQAENALRVRNVVLARELADKAANVASQLKR